MKKVKHYFFVLIFLYFTALPLSSLGQNTHHFLYNSLQNSKYNTSNGYSITATNLQNNLSCIQKNFYKINGLLHQTSLQKFCSNRIEDNFSSQSFDFSFNNTNKSPIGHGDDGTVIVNLPFSVYNETFRYHHHNHLRALQNSSFPYQSFIESDFQQNSQQTPALETIQAPFSPNTTNPQTNPSFSNPANAAAFNFQTFRQSPMSTTEILTLKNFSAPVPAPEPTTWILLGTSLFFLGLYHHRRKKRSFQKN